MKCFIILLLCLTGAFTDNVALDEFINGNSLFAVSTYKELLKDEQTFMVSPLSAEIILALVYSGSKGETAQELQTSLHLPNSHEKTESAIKALLPTFQSNQHYALHAANKMYLKKSLNLKEEFRKTASEVYQADTEIIDFSKREEAAKTMNEWVEKQTANKIKDLISPANLDGYTVAILINALYFKGNWSIPFDPHSIKKANFYKTSKDVLQVDTMYLYEEYFNYYECSELKAKFLELPFEGDDISMTIILPNDKDGLADLENQMEKVFTPHELTKELVNVALPKFKIETTIDFKKILENLGVKKAFGDGDLSGIAGEKGDLIITDVIQKTFINVDDKGVEAAAATFVAIRGDSAFISTTKPKEFFADHPFIFYIKAKNLIMFAGRVLVPTK